MRLVASFLCRYHHGGFYQSIYEISWLQIYSWPTTTQIKISYNQKQDLSHKNSYYPNDPVHFSKLLQISENARSLWLLRTSMVL